MSCRLSRFGSYPPRDFNRISCSYCYDLLKFVFPESMPQFNVTSDGYLSQWDERTDSIGLLLDPTRSADVQIVQDTMDSIEFEKWNKCCRKAELCCTDVMMKDSTQNLNGTCASIWDGWSCHSATQAGLISKVRCPDHFIADTCSSVLDYVYFQCNSDGTWFKNEIGEWADYTSCIQPILPIKQRLSNLNIITHSVSLLFLVIGLIIFFSFRQLKVNRITIHKNFFLSLIFHSFVQIIWESVIMQPSLTNSSIYIDSNHAVCIILNILLQYSRSTNYFWMLCESLYLHQLLISVFREQSNLLVYYIIGWGVPMVLCTVYAICTFLINNHSCWTRNLKLIYIMNAPNILTILLNFVFLINIIRIVYKKLTASNVNESHQYRRAVKSTLILVPLFGLHFILSPYVMCDSQTWSQLYNQFNRFIEAVQGLIVAMIYCFFNAEITCLIKDSLRSGKVFKWIKLSERKRKSRAENGGLAASAVVADRGELSTPTNTVSPSRPGLLNSPIYTAGERINLLSHSGDSDQQILVSKKSSLTTSGGEIIDDENDILDEEHSYKTDLQNQPYSSGGNEITTI